jgi:hypothetical protein
MRAWALAGLAGLACLACPTAQARTTAYGVAIGNNAPPLRGGGDLARLRFADDDAVRFHQFFTQFADNAWLLSVLDEETQKRYPQMLGVAQPPTLRALRAVIRELASRMKTDLERGDQPTLYLAYSGHGAHLPDGTAFLVLADGELTQKILYEEVLESLPATFVHLIVDACHAEAVVGARGLFGKEADAASVRLSKAEATRFLEGESLRRFPHVGALLATTRDQQSHEWSRLESGVFAHELLSGVSGAADVNGDGVVEYSEIQAFVAAANSDIRDPRALPRIVAHPPAVNPRAPLVSLAWMRGVAFLAGDCSPLEHFHIELPDGQRSLDAHLTSEMQSRIAVPADQVAFVVAGNQEAELRAGAGETLNVKALRFRERDAAARGAIDTALRATLFQTPFGPTYYRGFADSIGVSRVSFAPEAKAPSAPSAYRKPLAISVLALAGLSLAAMATSTGIAISARRDYNATDLQRPAAEAHARYERYGAAAIATGVGAATAGLIGYLLWPSEARSTTSLSPAVLPGGGGLSLAGSW